MKIFLFDVIEKGDNIVAFFCLKKELFAQIGCVSNGYAADIKSDFYFLKRGSY